MIKQTEEEIDQFIYDSLIRLTNPIAVQRDRYSTNYDQIFKKDTNDQSQ